MVAHQWTDAEIAIVRDGLAHAQTIVEISRRIGRSESSVRRFIKKGGLQNTGTSAPMPTISNATPVIHFPSPCPAAGGPSLPDAWSKPLSHVQVNDAGWWLILGDTHLPMHDRRTIEAAIDEAREKNVVGVLLNGDIMDMHGITPFFREPSRERFVDELAMAKQFIEWIRSRLPKARMIYREGNHEFRLRRYIAEKAVELYELPEIHLPKLIELEKHGVEWVQDKRQVILGKLITLHGHEFRKGSGINPARLAFLRATATCIVSHHHRSSDHPQRALDDKLFNTWSIGCACFLKPDYDPYNQWNHGYAMVLVDSNGFFQVHNRKLDHGRVQ